MAAAAAEPPAAAPELKSRFRTREGSYRLLGPAAASSSSSSSSASSSSAAAAGPVPTGPLPPGPAALPPVRLSVVRLAKSRSPPGGAAERSRVCCNLGRELHFYGGAAGAGGRGNRRSLDLQRPIDKRVYKGTQPTCHDFNQFTAGAETLPLLVGFSAGQVQCLDLAKKDSAGRLFNEERLIDKSKVTSVKWLPATERLFVASHASGHLYLYDCGQPCVATSPQYTLVTQGEGFRVFSCKSKTPRNPVLKWVVGSGALNEFAFSPDGRWLACVSQDGVLRVFHFSSMLLQGMMRSYFGGLLCVCWSPDGRYVVTGGEDDLVTVWSLAEGRVVARGHGHKSWVNAVAFDPFTTSPPPHDDDDDGDHHDDDGDHHDDDDGGHHDDDDGGHHDDDDGGHHNDDDQSDNDEVVTYRFGSAGQDTQFCLWDLTRDVLKPHPPLPRPHPPIPRSLSRSNSLPQPPATPQTSPHLHFSTSTHRGTHEEHHQHHHSLINVTKGGTKGDKTPGGLRPGGSRGALDTAKVLGTTLCPRLHEVPLLEPLVCKKIARERLTVLLFLEDCIVTACQQGLICAWARPGGSGLSSQNGGSPSGTVV
ncbi:dystrophia myotonica WD repeat-containing protein-like [Sylvia borin]